MSYHHFSVMLKEALSFLDCNPNHIYVDCTLGGSGHAKAICEKIIPDGILIGIDQDIDAINNAEKVLAPYRSNVHLFHGNFVSLPDFLSQVNITSVDGILLDLGISLHQLESSGRGFSFRKDEPLDMRMNVKSRMNAFELINRFKQKELKAIFKKYGEEAWSGRIARKIVETRKVEPIRTSGQLAQIAEKAIPKKIWAKQKIHPATRIFMAIRIAVNKELEVLERFMENAVNLLKPNGRLCVLSFHSLEDRIVKHRMKEFAIGCTCPPDLPKCVCNGIKLMRPLHKKVIRPSAKEVQKNPMARSAKLRAYEKIAIRP